MAKKKAMKKEVFPTVVYGTAWESALFEEDEACKARFTENDRLNEWLEVGVPTRVAIYEFVGTEIRTKTETVEIEDDVTK